MEDARTRLAHYDEPERREECGLDFQAHSLATKMQDGSSARSIALLPTWKMDLATKMQVSICIIDHASSQRGGLVFRLVDFGITLLHARGYSSKGRRSRSRYLRAETFLDFPRINYVH